MPDTKRLLVLALATAALSAGCLGGVPTTPAPLRPPDAAAPGAPAELKQLSEQGGARFADVAVGADGVLHALYVEALGGAGRQQVYYRASTDGGATWSTPLNLTADDPDAAPGFARIAIDGAGRVYAVWKDDTDWQDMPSGARHPGTLVYRALEGGAWSPRVVVSRKSQAVSWFPAVDPAGRMHLVWNELTEGGGFLTLTGEAGSVSQATLTGDVFEAREIHRTPLTPRAEGGLDFRPGYDSLSGYVDASGRAHFLAPQIVAKGTVESAYGAIVYWDGERLTPVLDAHRYVADRASFQDPPVLFLDAAGTPHVLAVDLSGARPTLLDHPLDGSAPVVVARIEAATGEFRGFQARTGPNGQVAVVMSLHEGESVPARFDSVATRFDGRRWGRPVNVTNNAAREAYRGTLSSATLDTYDAQTGAAVVGADGRLQLVLVNNKATSVRLGYRYGTGSTTDVFFHQL